MLTFPRLLAWSKKSYLLILLFVFSTAYFLFQHFQFLNWDFATYVLNAKYWFAHGWYFEALRPPLTSFMLGLLSIFGWTGAEYLYLVAVSGLFCFSSIKLSQQLKIQPVLFYFLSLNFYLLYYGLQNGTELLALSFLQLFLAALIQKKQGGWLLGLACLTRYNVFLFFILLLFYKNPKKIITNVLLFFLPLIPWFVYNYINFGNMFASIIDNYALNVAFRETAADPIRVSHFLISLNSFWPISLLGIGLVCKKIIKNKKIVLEIVVISISASIVIFTYLTLPAKDERFLFLLIPSGSYFTHVGLQQIIKIKNRYCNLEHVFYGIYFLVTLSVLVFFVGVFDKKVIQEIRAIQDSIKKLQEQNLAHCALKTNNWIYYNYYGLRAEPFAFRENVEKYLDEGYTQVLFYNMIIPGYQNDQPFMQHLPILYKNDQYVIMSKQQCKKPRQQLAGLLIHALDYEYTQMGKSDVINNSFCNNLTHQPLMKILCEIGDW